MSKIRPPARDAIVEAAFEIFAARPGASLGEVAERAGVGRATLHRHFPGREKLMRELALIAQRELDEAVKVATQSSETYESGFRQSLFAIIPLANRQWFLTYEIAEADSEVAAAYRASRDELFEDVEGAKTEGLFDPAIPTDWVVECYENLVFAAWSLVRAGKATPNQAAELAWQTFKNGLRGKT